MQYLTDAHIPVIIIDRPNRLACKILISIDYVLKQLLQLTNKTSVKKVKINHQLILQHCSSKNDVIFS